MELELKNQAVLLLLSLLLGVLMALLYDLLRPLRYRVGKALALLLDMLFCAASFIFAFTFAMGAGNGRLGQWELFGMLLGFLGYMHFLSNTFLRFFEALTVLILRVISASKNLLKKVVLSAKFFFQNVRKCFIIKR